MFTNPVLQMSVVVGFCVVSGGVIAQQTPAPQQSPAQQQGAVQQQVPVQQGPAQQQAPVQRAPVQQAPVQQAPVQQAPVQQYPTKPNTPPQYHYLPLSDPPQYYYQQVPSEKVSLVHGYLQGGYSETAGRTSNYLQGGYVAGAGFSVAPAPGSPVAFRFDFSYARNNATTAFLEANQSINSAINEGSERIWSGTLDLEFRVPLGGGVHAYFLGGGGAYNTRLTFREPVFIHGGYYGGWDGSYYCDPFMGFCGGGYGEVNVASHSVTKFGWNAGAGLDFPLGNGASWFLEGRYHRVRVSNASIPIAYIPITIGLRF
jgi:opacity protein-like surface antigen